MLSGGDEDFCFPIRTIATIAMHATEAARRSFLLTTESAS
jgi:hypothetical protein